MRNPASDEQVFQPVGRVSPGCHPLHRGLPDQETLGGVALHQGPPAHHHQGHHEERHQRAGVLQNGCGLRRHVPGEAEQLLRRQKLQRRCRLGPVSPLNVFLLLLLQQRNQFFTKSNNDSLKLKKAALSRFKA